MRKTASCLLALSLLTGGPLASADVTGYAFEADYPRSFATEFEPTEEYVTFRPFGFTVRISGKTYRDDKPLVDRTMHIIRTQLTRLAYVVEPKELAQIKRVEMWFTSDYDECRPNAPAWYHSGDGEWLRSRGRNPDMAGAVEVCDLDSFVNAYTQHGFQFVLVHELTHGFHDQFIEDGYGNQSIIDAYELAMATGRYQWAQKFDGDFGIAYAAKNRMEYFAEITTAFFATNTTYPFVKPELITYDPDGYRLIGRHWFDARRLSCRAKGTLRPRYHGFRVNLTFRNETDEDRDVTWLDFDGNVREEWRRTIAPGAGREKETISGHAWIVLDPDDECREIIVAGGDDETFLLRK